MTKHAKTIHPWRGSGRNHPGYARPSQAPQRPLEDDEGGRGHVVSLGEPQPSASAQAVADSLAGRVTLGPLTIEAEPHEHFVTVYLRGHAVRIRATSEIAFSQGRLGAQLLVRSSPIHRAVVVVGTSLGLREVLGLPLDIVGELTDDNFS